MVTPERIVQGSSAARAAAMQRFQYWGAHNLVKVTNPAPIKRSVGGYITLIQTIADKTPAEISRLLGLREQDLATGAMLYTLERIPMEGEFEVRGYTTLPDGLRLPQGQTQDPGGYRVGTGALQYELTHPVPATLLGELRPGERADIRKLRAAQASNRTLLSGAAWLRANQGKYPNSSSIGDLAPVFGASVRAFIDALYEAGATVQVSSTKRNRSRAYLMHFAWRIAEGSIAPKDVPRDPDVKIIWDHGDARKSREAARDMVAMFGIVYQPSLSSNHIMGNRNRYDHCMVPLHQPQGCARKTSSDRQALQRRQECSASCRWRHVRGPQIAHRPATLVSEWPVARPSRGGLVREFFTALAYMSLPWIPGGVHEGDTSP